MLRYYWRAARRGPRQRYGMRIPGKLALLPFALALSVGDLPLAAQEAAPAPQIVTCPPAASEEAATTRLPSPLITSKRRAWTTSGTAGCWAAARSASP